jgi:hypothetical protein
MEAFCEARKAFLVYATKADTAKGKETIRNKTRCLGFMSSISVTLHNNLFTPLYR